MLHVHTIFLCSFSLWWSFVSTLHIGFLSAFALNVKICPPPFLHLKHFQNTPRAVNSLIRILHALLVAAMAHTRIIKQAIKLSPKVRVHA